MCQNMLNADTLFMFIVYDNGGVDHFMRYDSCRVYDNAGSLSLSLLESFVKRCIR